MCSVAMYRMWGGSLLLVVVSYVVGDRSPPDVPAVVGGHSRGISAGALLHGCVGGLHVGDCRGTTPCCGQRDGETAHIVRWNNTLCQRLARFVRMTFSFSRVGDDA